MERSVLRLLLHSLHFTSLPVSLTPLTLITTKQLTLSTLTFKTHWHLKCHCAWHPRCCSPIDTKLACRTPPKICINQTFCRWRPVTSGSHSELSSAHLDNLDNGIDNLDNGIVSKGSKFSDDTKLCHSSRHHIEVHELQESINKLVDSANKWKIAVQMWVQRGRMSNYVEHIYKISNQ